MKNCKTLNDLPEKALGGGYYLPNWKMFVNYRATAWAYLNREDGGETVEICGGEEKGTVYKIKN